jgi:hypothetical protein
LAVIAVFIYRFEELVEVEVEVAAAGYFEVD